MVTNEIFRQMALSFSETAELPHFDRASFRVNKKIFCTLLEKESLAMVKLSPLDQSVFCAFDRTVIYPVPGGWGLKGATYINLQKVKKTLLKDAMTVAYCTTAPKKLAEKYLTNK
jgi:hypothetical protein